ncbi:MAG: hypothetical protein KDD82_11185 [Planctomycetes bacterium]|nr:hypothetical protein [Planctomycetota bacterium]
MRRVCVILDGVDYLHGPRPPILAEVELAGDADAATARAGLERVLSQQTGRDARLRAGWSAVRVVSLDGASWDGPAFLFSLDAPEVGDVRIEAAGEDPSPWDPPPAPGEFASG